MIATWLLPGPGCAIGGGSGEPHRESGDDRGNSTTRSKRLQTKDSWSAPASVTESIARTARTNSGSARRCLKRPEEEFEGVGPAESGGDLEGVDVAWFGDERELRGELAAITSFDSGRTAWPTRDFGP